MMCCVEASDRSWESLTKFGQRLFIQVERRRPSSVKLARSSSTHLAADVVGVTFLEPLSSLGALGAVVSSTPVSMHRCFHGFLTSKLLTRAQCASMQVWQVKEPLYHFGRLRVNAAPSAVSDALLKQSLCLSKVIREPVERVMSLDALSDEADLVLLRQWSSMGYLQCRKVTPTREAYRLSQLGKQCLQCNWHIVKHGVPGRLLPPLRTGVEWQPLTLSLSIKKEKKKPLGLGVKIPGNCLAV